jgi:DNA (cytosine-5)-methyltransferase 1
MKVLELFSGYGTASFALKRLGIPYEIIGYSDIDKYANQCFKQNHGGKELGDVRKIKISDLEDFDLLTSGFPCQAFSYAGKMQGEADPRGTLFYEIIRIAEVKKPKYMLLENVKGLTAKKFEPTFKKILSELNRIGYNIYWKVLNSKDFGIPQSRARVWFVCFRKDIDSFMRFQFPNPVKLKIFIKDILEPSVDKKYYLSPLLQERFKRYLEGKTLIDAKTKIGYEEVMLTLRSGSGSGNKPIVNDSFSVQLANKNRGKIPYNSDDREMTFDINKEPVSFTIKQARHEFLVYDKKNPVKVMQLCGDRDNPSLSVKEDIVNSINANPMSDRQQAVDDGQLRRLTPKECFRLMGFLNDEINLDNISDTQKYKLAGNGQDVNIVSLIFKEMFTRLSS